MNSGGEQRNRKRWHAQAARRGLCALSLAALPGAAVAGEWRIDPFVSLQETVTDNARSSATNRDSDLVSEATAGLRISGQGARAKLNLNYSGSYEKYLDNNDLDGYRQSLAATGNSEILKDSFFVDAQASISRIDQDRGSTVSGTDRNTGSNQQDVYLYSLSPYWRSRIGGVAETELRVRRSQTFTVKPSSSSGTTGTGGTANTANSASDTTTNEVSTAIASGSDFERFLWKVSGLARESDRTLGKAKFYNGEGKAQYDVGRGFALLATTGYDEIDDGTTTKDVSGPYFLGGFLWTPSPRTRFRVQGGYRYNEPSFDGEASWEITARTKFTAKYGETVGLAIDDFLAALNNTRIDGAGNFVDKTTGLIYSGRDVSGLSTGDGLSRTKTFSANIATNWTRDNLQFSFVHTERETLSTSIAAGTVNSPGTQTVDTFLITYGHALTPQLSSSFTLSYSESEAGGGAGRSDETIRATASASYTFNPTLNGNISYSYLDRSGNTGTVTAVGNQGDVTENVVTISLRKSF